MSDQKTPDAVPADTLAADDLRRLRPAAPALDAVALAYAAGRRSARASTWRWRGVAGVALVVFAIDRAIGHRDGTPGVAPAPSPTIVLSVPPPEASPPASPRSAPDPVSLAVLQRRVLESGLDGLSAPASRGDDRPMRVNETFLGGSF